MSAAEHDLAMDDDVRLGTRVRAVRMRLGWRQIDLATRAGVSATTVHRIEHGRLDGIAVGVVRRTLRELEISLELLARWRGGDLDRLADEGHAILVGIVAKMLEAAGWRVQTEVSFSIFGERGSIDLLAWHAQTRTLLVVEVKTTLNSVEETLRRHDTKNRLGARIARERCGWDARSTAALLALPDDATARRRVARHAAVFNRAIRCEAARREAGSGSRRVRRACSSSPPREGPRLGSRPDGGFGGHARAPGRSRGRDGSLSFAQPRN